MKGNEVKTMKDSMIKVFRIQSFRNGGELIGDWVVIADNSQQALMKTRQHYPSHKNCMLMVSQLDIVKDEAFIELYYKCGAFI